MTPLRSGESKKKKHRSNRKPGNNNLRGGKVGEGRRGAHEMCSSSGVLSLGEWHPVVQARNLSVIFDLAFSHIPS